MDTRKSLGMVFRCISMDLGRTLTFNINFRPPPPSEGPPDGAGREAAGDKRKTERSERAGNHKIINISRHIAINYARHTAIANRHRMCQMELCKMTAVLSLF